MDKVTVRQSASRHPGSLTADELNELFAGEPLGSIFDPVTEIGAYRSGGTGRGQPTRGEAGVLVIGILYVLDKVTGGALSKAGEDFYSFARRRLAEAMRRKRKATEDSTATYPFRPPEWRVEVEAETGENSQTGFVASLGASTPEGMTKAAQLLAETLARESDGWELDRRRYVWRAEQRGDQLQITQLIYDLDGDGHIDPEPSRQSSSSEIG
jgi:hypothetical protein